MGRQLVIRGFTHAGEKLTCVCRDRLREDLERFTVHRARVGDVRAPGSLVEFGAIVRLGNTLQGRL